MFALISSELRHIYSHPIQSMNFYVAQQCPPYKIIYSLCLDAQIAIIKFLLSKEIFLLHFLIICHKLNQEGNLILFSP